MSKSFSLKKIVIITSIAIIALIFLLLLILSIASKKPIAAFYGISEANIKGITKVLQTTHTRKNKKSAPYEILVLDDTTSIGNAIKRSKKKPALLFIYNGANAESVINQNVKKKLGFEPSVIEGMPTSIRQITPIFNKKVIGVPLLIDNYEVDVNVAKFTASSIENINVLSDLENLAKLSKSSTMAPVIFAGGDDITLINTFAALAEALSGKDAVESAKLRIKQSIKSGKSSQSAFYELLKDLCAPEGEFYEVTMLLKNWMTYGIVPKNLYHMNFTDVRSFLTSNLSTICFMTLSEHRLFQRNVISKFSSIYVPGKDMNNERNFQAPVILAIPMKKNKVINKSIELLTNNLQTQLSSATGLAPVQANCGIPDHQADDVRYWVAASGKPLPAFSDAVFINKPNKTSFAQALRSILQS